MEADRDRWNRRYAQRIELAPPDAFLVEAFDRWIASRFPHGGRGLDLAGGRGQNAMFLVERGWQVTLVDVSDAAIEQAKQQARDRELSIEYQIADAGDFLARTEAAAFDLVMVFFFLDRRLWDEIRRVLRHRGLLLYKTYTVENLKFGREPSNPDYLLRPGELPAEFSDFELLHSRETYTNPATAELAALHR
jgi:SAM-dependent methyltransferase